MSQTQIQPQIQPQPTKPDSGQQTPTFTTKISKTTYVVKVHFNPDSKETLQQKIERMIKNEVRYGSTVLEVRDPMLPLHQNQRQQ